MTGTNAEKAHYKRIQRARRVAEGMVRVETWLTAEEARRLDIYRTDWKLDRGSAIANIVGNYA